MPDAGIISRLSPTTLGTIRRCGLAAYYRARRPRDRGPSRSSPPARLGNAAHEVMRWFAEADAAMLAVGDVESLARREWNSALAIQEQKSLLVPSERSFGSARDWPRRSLIEERVVIASEQLLEYLSTVPLEARKAEFEIESPESPLWGTVDLCVTVNGQSTLIDYKTGDVPPGSLGGAGQYRSQLLLYAALARERGLAPSMVQLWPLGRPKVTLATTDALIDAAMGEALRDLASYNALASRRDLDALGSPSDDACRWCEFASTCAVLWSGGSSRLTDLQIIKGTVTSVNRSANGRLLLGVDASAGTKRGAVVIAGVDESRFTNAEGFHVGHLIVGTGLKEVSPGSSTLSASGSGWLSTTVDDDGASM